MYSQRTALGEFFEAYVTLIGLLTSLSALVFDQFTFVSKLLATNLTHISLPSRLCVIFCVLGLSYRTVFAVLIPLADWSSSLSSLPEIVVRCWAGAGALRRWTRKAGGVLFRAGGLK
jgi:hypothetical protein